MRTLYFLLSYSNIMSYILLIIEQSRYFGIDIDQLVATRLYSRRLEDTRCPIAFRAVIQGDFLALLCVDSDDAPDGRSCLVMGNFMSDQIVVAVILFVSD